MLTMGIGGDCLQKKKKNDPIPSLWRLSDRTKSSGPRLDRTGKSDVMSTWTEGDPSPPIGF
jgi:hypothetical protein